MVDLPRGKRTQLIDQIGVVRMDGGGGLSALGAGLGGIASDVDMDQRRARAEADEVYLADFYVRQQRRSAEMSAEAGEDPDRFDATFKGHAEGALTEVPDRLKRRAASVLDRAGTARYTSLLDKKSTRDRALEEEALGTAADELTDEYVRHAQFTDPTAVSRATAARTDLQSALGTRVSKGHISPEMAAAKLRGADMTARAEALYSHVQRVFKTDGALKAFAAADAIAADPDIPIRIRERYQNRAQEFIREQVSVADMRDRQSERAIREQREATGRTLWKLDADGQLTRDWLDKNSGALSKDDYKAGLNALQNPDPPADDRPLYADLSARVYREDIGRDLQAAYLGGRLKKATFAELRNINASERNQDQPKSEYQQSLRDITEKLGPIPGVSDETAGARLANARRVFDDFVRKPKADGSLPTDSEVRRQAVEIIERFQVLDWDKLTSTMMRPKFLVGTRQQPNLDATDAATMKALDEGRITAEEAAREAELLDQWHNAKARFGDKK